LIFLKPRILPARAGGGEAKTAHPDAAFGDVKPPREGRYVKASNENQCCLDPVPKLSRD
jgi:hypothetical protein